MVPSKRPELRVVIFTVKAALSLALGVVRCVPVQPRTVVRGERLDELVANWTHTLVPNAQVPKDGAAFLVTFAIDVFPRALKW